MASAQNDTTVIGGTMITLSPLSGSNFPTVIKSPSIAGGQFQVMNIASGATLALLTSAVAGASVGGATSLATSLVGYPLSATSTLAWVGPASFYLACAGSTCQISFAFEYAGGATLA